MGEDVFIFIVMMTMVLVAGRIILKKMEMGRHSAAAKPQTKHDYVAWNEGQKANERHTKKEIELFKLKKAERDEARKTYERLVNEKLEVIKMAMSMGAPKAELEALDMRLEKLIGQGKIERLLDEDIVIPEPTSELMDNDLDVEIKRLQAMREKGAQT